MHLRRRRGAKSRKGSSYWQRVILVVAALFVVYTLARPGPQIDSVSSWARDLSSGVTLGVERQGPREAVGDAPLAPATVTVPANDSRFRPEGSPLSPVPRYGCPSIVAKRKLDVSGNVSEVGPTRCIVVGPGARSTSGSLCPPTLPRGQEVRS